MRSVRLRLPAVVFAFAGTLLPASASAATITVNAGGDLQAAINRAQPGDTILLQAGATFTGNFTLPVKPGSSYITIRSAAADTSLPPAGVRMDPRYASLLPKLRSPNTASVMRTATGAHHWRLQFLEFLANVDGAGEILRLGSSSETVAANQPRYLIIDRVYIHGHSRLGSKRAIALNSGDTSILNSYISDIKAAGMDSQAICGWNGPGPYRIENNYLEAAAENILFGGSSPAIQSLVPSNITIRRNLFRKNLAWRNPVVATPTGVTALAGTGGSLAPGTYKYRVVAYAPCGNAKTCRSTASSEVAATLAATGAVNVSWTPVSGATSYRVYGRTAGQNQYWSSTGTSVRDTGVAGTSGAVPTTAGTKWVVKNLLEFKNGRQVLIEGNVLEYCWQQDQKGYAVVLMPANSGTAPWTAVQDITFRYNIVQHVSAGMQVVGRDVSRGSEYSRNIVVQHNLFTELNPSKWGGPGVFLSTGHGTADLRVDHNTVVHTGFGVAATGEANVGFVFTNNMLKHNTGAIVGDGRGAGWDSINVYFPGLDMRRNVLAGASSSRYPADNFFPPTSDFLLQFVNAGGGDYRLAAASPYNNAGTDGTDVGANIDRIRAAQ